MDKTIKSASQLFEKRYGAQLEIKWTSQSSPNASSASDWQSSFVYSRTRRQVSFPLYDHENDLKAIAIASPVDNKDAILFEEMADFLKLTIAEQIQLQEKKDFTEHSELAFNLAHRRLKNVIPLPRRRSKNIEKLVTSNSRMRKPDNRPIYLYGENKDLIHRVCMASHDWSKNWAFINAKEIPDLIWQDKDHWRDFPQITICIPDVESLSPKKQDQLASNIEFLRTLGDKKPLIIVTGNQHLNQTNSKLSKMFKIYSPSDKLSAKSQAHFLMFHFKNKESWTYQCPRNKGIFYYPFSKAPQQFH